MKKILAIGAHCDDIELGMGATTYKHREDWEVACWTFSSSDHMRALSEMALTFIGAKRMHYLGFPVGGFSNHRQEIHTAMVQAREWGPDLVFTHERDEHQDHQDIHDETLRCFRNYSIIAYQPTRHSGQGFLPNLYEGVDEFSVSVKLVALSYYKAVYPDKTYMDPDFLRSEMRAAGISTGLTYAEAFRVVKLKNPW